MTNFDNVKYKALDLPKFISQRAAEMTDKELVTRCYCCGNDNLKSYGKLPKFNEGAFGGQSCDVVLIPGDLYECLDCHLFFRYPRVEQKTLRRLYEELPSTVWTCNEPRYYWDLLLKILNKVRQKVVLDVGCFSGDFLAWLPNDWTKLGVEPNKKAADRAREKEIKIIGSEIHEFTLSSPENAQPSAITLIDVIEHLDDPVATLTEAKRILDSGGIIVIVTGNTDCLAFRLLSPDYWYSSLPEHITFYNKRWFQWIEKKLGLKIVHFKRLPSEKVSFVQNIIQGLKLITYVAVKRLSRIKCANTILKKVFIFKKIVQWQSTPWWTGARDHLLVVLQA